MIRLVPDRDFRLIWSASVVSQLGDWASRLALALLLLARGEGPAVIGIAGALFVAPWLGIGQLLTAWSTRFGRRAVLIGCDSLRGIAFVIIGLADLSVPFILVLVGVAALADPVFEATKSAFVTEIVTTDDYAAAIQVTHVANQAASLVGYAAGGLLVAALGAETTLSLNGLSFLVSAGLVAFVSQPGTQHTERSSRPSLATSLGFLRHDRLSALAFGATLLAVTTAMSVESQVTVYGSRVADLGDTALGLLSASTPAATLVVVALLRTPRQDRTALRRGLIVAAGAAAVGAATLYAGTGAVLSFVGFALVGVVFAFPTITNVVVGRRLPDHDRVRIFSILQGGVFLGLSGGAIAGGLLSELTSPERAAGSALVVCAVGLVAIGAIVPTEDQPTSVANRSS